MIRSLAVAAGVVLMTALALDAAPAQAQTTYRYWSYWIGGETWTYSARGPGFRSPPDGGVEGWRFVVSPKDGSQAVSPSESSTYDALCPGQPAAPAGQKRVAVVIDPGAPGIAPVGNTPPPKSVNCVVVPSGATGLQVLQKITSVRFHSSGLICGIAGFPATECPGQQAAAAPTPRVSTSSKPTVQPVVPPVATSAGTTGRTLEPGGATAAASPGATSPPPAAATGASPGPSAVALGLGDPPAEKPGTAPPTWIAAIGAAMIAALLGLAMLVRRGRS